MRGLASFVMRGRGQATLVAATTAVLSALVPPVSWLSSGTVALVVLRRGTFEGLVVLLGALVGAGVLAFVSLGSPWPALSFALVLWLPILIVAAVLRATVDLGSAFAALGGIGLVAVAVIHLLLGEPGPWWLATLEPVIAPALQGVEGAEAGAIREWIAAASRYLTGLMVAAGLINLVLGLLIGRAWQAALYNPGGFRREFHALRLPRVAALVATGLFAAVFALGGAPGMVADMAAAMLVPCALAGLALVHGLAGGRRGGVGILVAVYLLLVLALPQTTVALAAMGLVNSWFDLARRYGARPKNENSADG
ncbi:MAG: hypothetical protein R3298_08370 [Gammaproteobacteria bacterium]|nr:hypothetical protein [Gammaproteobacteria bacterium]